MNKEFFKKLKDGIISTTVRFPGVIFFTILAYIFFPYRKMTIIDEVIRKDITNLIRYGIGMSFMIEIILENLKQKNIRLRLICYGVMTAILLGMLGCGFFNIRDLSYGFVFTALASVTLIAFAHKERGLAEENYVVLMLNSLKAGLFALLFIAGEVLVVFLIGLITNTLVSMSVYREVIVITYLFMYTFIYYSSIPRIGDRVESPKYLKNIIKFIFIPFTLLTEVFGGVYIMQNMEDILRHSSADILSIWLLMIVISVIIIVFIDVIAKVVENEVEGKLIKISRKIIAGLLMPAILMGVYLIIKLYAETGITIMLYISVMTFLVATVFIVDILARNSKSSYIGFVVLAILSIIASIKPFSPERLEERSKLKRRTAIVNEYYVTRDNRIKDSGRIEIEKYLDCWK